MAIIDNFWSYTARDDRGCWNWTASTQGSGYGQLQRNGTTFYAHRVAWELANGRPPDKGLSVLHKCDNKRCVNPAHLFLGTQLDNMRDCLNKGRNPRANKTHCPHGHPYDAANTIVRPEGRYCRACRYAHNHSRKLERIAV